MKSPVECSSIEEVRAAIDDIDYEIVKALALRSQYVKAVTRFKKTKEDVKAPARQAAVISQRRAWAAEEGLDPELVEKLYRMVMDHFVAEEMRELHLIETDN